jgi:hypothetical protein
MEELMRLQISCLLIALFLQTGCALIPSSTNYSTKMVAPEGKTQVDLDQDVKACTKTYFWKGREQVNDQFYLTCMDQKGYKLVTQAE